MSKPYTIFLSYSIMGRKPVIVIKYGGGNYGIKTYKTVFDMPGDLRHQYWGRRLAHKMSHNK